MKFKVLLVLLFIILLTACVGLQTRQQAPLQELAQRMTGSFNSNQQSISDKNYYDINLEMRPIWQERTDGVWLYVEQAVSDSLDKPYRQRVYHLTQLAPNRFKSKVYALKDPKIFIGAQNNKTLFAALEPGDLIERKGCSVYLTYNSGIYSGSTDDKACESNLRGASYATSIVTVYPNRIESWDQGFDANDKQVWGAVKGAYIFNRK